MKQVICFDLWETLIRSKKSNGAGYEKILIRLGAKKPDIYPLVRERLMTTQSDYYTMFSKLCFWLKLNFKQEDIEEGIKKWKQDNQNVEWIKGAEQTIKKLQSPNRSLVLITNITAPAWKEVREKFNIFNDKMFFAEIYVSCLLGFSKPDKRIWNLVEKKFPNAQEFWMVGDKELDDLAIPEERGWKTILVNKSRGINIEKIPKIIN